MKFNETQKKWAMTGLLLAVLGFNISPPKAFKDFTIADMASSEAPVMGKITNSDGVYQVEYRASGDQTVAKVSKVLFDTESGASTVCSDCTKTYVLDKSIKTQLDQLNMVTAQVMAGSAKKAVDAPAPADQPADDSDSSSKKVAKNKEAQDSSKLEARLNELSADCKDSEGMDQLTCYTDGLSEIFTALRSKDIKDSVVESFVQRKVLPVLSSLVLENRKAQYNYENGLTTVAPESDITLILKPYEDLITNVPDDHAKLQKDLVQSSTSIKVSELNFISRLNKQANSSSGSEKTSLLGEALWRGQTSGRLDRDLDKMAASADIVLTGDKQANQFAAGLQQSLNEIWARYSTNQLSSDVIQVGDQVYTRVGSVQRGGVTSTPMVVSGVPAVPGSIPTQINSTGNIVIPVAPNSNGQVYTNGQQLYSNVAQPIYVQQAPQAQGGFVNPGASRTTIGVVPRGY